MTTLTDKDIDKQFKAAADIAKALLPKTDRTKRRIINYFLDLLDEESDMDEEIITMRQVADILDVKLN